MWTPGAHVLPHTCAHPTNTAQLAAQPEMLPIEKSKKIFLTQLRGYVLCLHEF